MTFTQSVKQSPPILITERAGLLGEGVTQMNEKIGVWASLQP